MITDRKSRKEYVIRRYYQLVDTMPLMEVYHKISNELLSNCGKKVMLLGGYRTVMDIIYKHRREG